MQYALNRIYLNGLSNDKVMDPIANLLSWDRKEVTVWDKKVKIRQGIS
jgi:hypothetical protein